MEERPHHLEGPSDPHVADLVRRPPRHFSALEEDAALVRFDETGDDINQRRFP